MTALSQDLLMNENQTVEMPNVTASSFQNTSAPAVTIQIVNNGVGVPGVTPGGISGGNNLLAINMETLVPGSTNFKLYRVYISGSATDLYTGISATFSGSSTVGTFASQIQAKSSYASYWNYKGDVATGTVNIPDSGAGTLACLPDNALITPADLTGNMLYFAGASSNGAVISFTGGTVDVWLTFSPVI